MTDKLPRLRSTVLLAVILVLLFGGTAVAATITVDGDPTDWPGHPSCTIGNSGCSLEANDPEESSSTAMPSNIDIREFWGTNDTSNVYFRYDTVTNTTNHGGGEFVRICMDVPNQGPGQSNVGGCTTINVDRLVVIRDFGAGLEARTFDCNSINCNTASALNSEGVGTFAQSNTVNEVSVALTDLGIDSADDGDTLDLVVFFDNNGLPPDDSVPDSGTIPFQIGSNSPTAISLQSVSAATTSNSIPVTATIGGLLLCVFGAGAILVRRRKDSKG